MRLLDMRRSPSHWLRGSPAEVGVTQASAKKSSSASSIARMIRMTPTTACQGAGGLERDISAMPQASMRLETTHAAKQIGAVSHLGQV